ncbi:MAG: hypothetical protein AB7L92_07475 [Alphaproteobacteria bacterium]
MSSRTDHTGFRRPGNEAILDSLSQTNRAHYLSLRDAAAKAAQEKPGMDTRVYTEFLHDYLIMAKNDERQVAADKEKYESIGKMPDMRQIHKDSQDRRDAFLRNFQDNKLPKYGANGQEAWKEFGQQIQGPSIFSAAIGQIYDKDQGGIKIGGIAGLLGGLALANALIPGGLMEGGLFGIIGGIIAAFGGAWLGNQAVGLASGLFGGKSKPEVQKDGPAQSQEKAQGPEQQQQQEISADAMRAAFEEHQRRLGITGGQEASSAPSQPTPGGTQQQRSTQPAPPSGGNR